MIFAVSLSITSNTSADFRIYAPLLIALFSFIPIKIIIPPVSSNKQCFLQQHSVVVYFKLCNQFINRHVFGAIGHSTMIVKIPIFGYQPILFFKLFKNVGARVWRQNVEGCRRDFCFSQKLKSFIENRFIIIIKSKDKRGVE